MREYLLSQIEKGELAVRNDIKEDYLKLKSDPLYEIAKELGCSSLGYHETKRFYIVDKFKIFLGVDKTNLPTIKLSEIMRKDLKFEDKITITSPAYSKVDVTFLGYNDSGFYYCYGLSHNRGIYDSRVNKVTIFEEIELSIAEVAEKLGISKNQLKIVDK